MVRPLNVAIVGAGQVGLVTAACLAEKGHRVVCADIDRTRVEEITAGRSFLYEPGLDELVRRHAGANLRATTDIGEAVRASELSLIAVSVPLDDEANRPLHALSAAARAIGRALRDRDDYHAVVVKSTVLPGTTSDIVRPLLEAESGRVAGVDFGVGMNPEFLTEGEAITEFMTPDRIVFGVDDERTLALLEELYAGFPGARLRTTPATAELIKLASNALLATMISFANDLADLASARGDVDVTDVTRGVHLSRYLTVGGADGATSAPLTAYLQAGCGFGGSCLPKDLAALHRHGRAVGAPMEVLEAVDRVNRRRAAKLVELVEHGLGSLRGARVTVLGVAFKPDTSDVRQSPAFPVVRRLAEAGATVRIYDPVAADAFMSASEPPVPAAAANLSEALEADAAVIVTRWSEFDAIPDIVRNHPSPPLIVDGRRMLAPDEVPRYAGVGLGRTAASATDVKH
jgi:UDPglucose 6-dehydrogenase